MKSGRILRVLTVAVLTLWLSLPAMADRPPRIGQPSYLDNQYMDQQRDAMDDLVRRNFGSQFNGNKDHDLELLQRLLDRQLVRPDETQQLQAMGIILGDLLAEDLGMHWVIYEDKVGRSRALRYRQSDDYLFPVTMISRRREADNRKAVVDIYRKAYDIIDNSRPPLPFQ